MGFNIDQQINFLKKIDFFENFDDHELRQFLTVTKWLKVPTGTLIIKENTIERVFYVLVKGEVSVFKTLEDGKRSMELTVLKSGACFGEMSLVMDVKRTAGVISRSDSFLLMVEPGIIETSNVFLQLKFYKRFCEILVSRLILANERVIGSEAPGPTFSLPKNVVPVEDVAGDAGPQSAPPEPPLSQETGPGPAFAGKALPVLPEKEDRMAKKSLCRKINGAMELPYNPAVAERLEPLLHGECENTLLLADLIQLDPVLSWKVMQVGNSSFYRRSMPVATVPHAMITVGIKHIQDTLAAVISSGRRRRPFSGFKPVARAFWRHSVVVARIANLLRDVIRLSLTTDIYLAGLFHDIGILALDVIQPQFYPHLIDPNSELCTNLCHAETTHIGIDHCRAGAMLGEGIGLPETYIDVMRFHHDPSRTQASQLSVALVHLAELFATIHGCGHCPEKTIPDPSPLESFAWVLIQENHRPFCEVNVEDFITSFDNELTKTWGSITDGLMS
jgi:HD-like signal output (HDOD) protein